MASLALPLPAAQSQSTPTPTSTLPPLAPAGNTNTIATASSSKTQPPPAAPARRRSSVNPNPPQRSPTPDDDEEEADDEEEDGPQRKSKKGKKGKTGGVGAGSGAGGGQGAGVGAGTGTDGKGDYKYQSEIAAMMFVFGEVQDPLPETTRLVEDIVRGQIIEIVTRARLLTHLRASRFLSPEDLIFLIRDDRGKVNRLRTYLSWKDVRKRAKEDDAGQGDVEVDLDEAEKSTAKGRKTMVKLPWELFTPFSDFLRNLPSNSSGLNGNRDDEEEEDEDEMQAHQDSMQRLRDADEITKKMTKDEYVHYSDCRQASFTFRKARRFREFLNFSAYLDVRPNDDIIDILGFLSFEMVRSLCVSALEVRDRVEAPVRSIPHPQKSNTHNGGITNGAAAASPSTSSSPLKRKSTLSATAAANTTDEANSKTPAQGQASGNSPNKKVKLEATSTSTNTAIIPATTHNGTVESPTEITTTTPSHQPQPLPTLTVTGSATTPAKEPQPPSQLKRHTTSHSISQNHGPHGNATAPTLLFAPPPSARRPLLPAHVLEAYAQIQRHQAASRVGGMRHFRGGLGRGRMPLV